MAQSSLFPDLDVFKEIPGYQAILKGVVKSLIQILEIPGSQAILKGAVKSLIQILIEQLSAHTGEESLILTASINDGTLSHLGSESGKVFLEENDDFKTKFLGFCLRRQHGQSSTETQTEYDVGYQAGGSQKVPSGRKVAQQRRAGLAPSSPYPISKPVPVSASTSYTNFVEPSSYIIDTSSMNQSESQGNILNQDQEIKGETSEFEVTTIVKEEPVDEDIEITGLDPGNQTMAETSFGQSQSETTFGQGQGDTTFGLSQGDPNFGQAQSDITFGQSPVKTPSGKSKKSLDQGQGGRVQVVNWSANSAGNNEYFVQQMVRNTSTTAVDQSGATGTQTQGEDKTMKDRPKAGIVPPNVAKEFGTMPLYRRQYYCNMCRASFSQASSLTRHKQVIHEGKRPMIKCDICGDNFSSENNKKRHVRVVHQNEKKHKCDECESSFATTASLKGHQLKVHGKGVQPTCEICNQQFTYAHYLNEHKRRCQQEAKYNCDMCDGVFKTRICLNRHKRCKHESKKFVCEHCGKAYPWSSLLSKHIKKKHTPN